MSEDNNRAHGIQQQPHNKPLLTVPEQIAHLRSKGVTFTLCTEADAARHLHEKCQFFRIYSYRGLFDKCMGGERNGQYANLDFAHLKELSNIDRRLRDVLLPMTLDVEHFTKVRLLAAAEDNGENGHTVMQDYFESLSQGQRSHIKNELNKRTEDPYSGALIHKYLGNMPLGCSARSSPLAPSSAFSNTALDDGTIESSTKFITCSNMCAPFATAAPTVPACSTTCSPTPYQ